MLPRFNGVGWTEGGGEEEDAVSWTRNDAGEHKEDDEDAPGGSVAPSLFSFKSMLEADWYANDNTMNPSHHDLQTLTNPNHCEIKDPISFSSNPISAADHSLLLQPLMDSSSSCEQSYDPSLSQPSFPFKSCFPSLLNVVCSNSFENAFDLGFLAPLQGNINNQPLLNSSVLVGFSGQGQMGNPEMGSTSEFQAVGMPPFPGGVGASGLGGFAPASFEDVEGSGGSVFLNRSKVLRPLEVYPPVGAQPTLFQKRLALRQSSSSGEKLGNFGFSSPRDGEVSTRADGRWGKRDVEEEELGKKRKMNEESELMEDASYDVSGLNYDSEEFNENDNKMEEMEKNGGSNSNANSTVTCGDRKGKRKGLPAKNLMAERRRRKKLNDRLYMLRSVVPKISKMDRASILGDAIEYLKELLQRIADLNNELDLTPPGSLQPPNTGFHPLTPTPPQLPYRVKEELCPSSLPSPKNQPARVEVRVREGKSVNIHMFCARRPGLLLSTMRALDNLGLDIQQAVVSCLNGFALDVFRAEQCREGQDVLPEQIKAVLLDSVGIHGII
ncbi:transcription factor ICE1-like [Malania oleifera]|uniref:transcription factor ICE1-like n=1 Tax=Malania oleifera TaxID=397392 RepID=UPI0025AE041D|nr:transcription factor ICE1-like [Malania oleifera]